MCPDASAAENITALCAGVHQNQTSGSIKTRNQSHISFRQFYKVNIKKAVYENPKMVEAERLTIYPDMKIYKNRRNQQMKFCLTS